MIERLLIVLLLGAATPSALALQWPPPGSNWPSPGGGDSKLPDGTSSTPHGSGWTSQQQATFDGAMQIAKAQNPSVAGLEAGIQNGAIGVVEIKNTPGSRDRVHGQVDSNTLGLELDGKSPEEVAAVIAHEWRHRTEWALDPSYVTQPRACYEADGYSAHLASLCGLLCPCCSAAISCSEYRRVQQAYESNANKCLAAGGTPVPPPSADCSPSSPLPCPCHA